jgi:putative restriction endonuclease
MASDAVPERERDVWLRRLASMQRWQRAGERAPHKPLLLLYAGRLHRGLPDEVRFLDAEPELQQLLREFGPPRTTTAAYPFRRLANDENLWDVSTPSGADPGDSPGRLRELHATGRLSHEFVSALRGDPSLLVLAARTLLEENWPESMHADLATAVGLELESLEAQLVSDRLVEEKLARRRDVTFRSRVLLAYEYRCAFCGYDGRLETTAVGLDAAHVRWWATDGPDTVDNGLCLCTMHHRLFDFGVLGISPEHEVVVSKHFVGHADSSRQLVLELVGRPMLEPQAGEPTVAEPHVAWHASQVFRGPERVRSGY